MKKLRRHLDPNTLELLKHVGVGVIMVTVVALFITAIWYGTRFESLTISQVEAVGGETINIDSIVRIAESELDGEYIGLIPRRFAWLYPDETIKAKVESLGRIYNVQLSRSGSRLLITFDEYIPDSLWCEEDMSVCVFVDTSAFAFSKAPDLFGGSFTRFITLGRAPIVGGVLMEVDAYENLLRLSQLLAEKEWFVSRIEVDQAGDAFLGLVGGGELKVVVSVPAIETVNNLFVVLSSDEFSHITPDNFAYIDLRFGNKVFVNEELVVPQEAVTNEEVTDES